jgi:glucose uptake protein GlcU
VCRQLDVGLQFRLWEVSELQVSSVLTVNPCMSMVATSLAGFYAIRNWETKCKIVFAYFVTDTTCKSRVCLSEG